MKQIKIEEIPYDLISKLINDVFDAEFNPNVSLIDMGLDELDGIELIMNIEKELDVYISDEEASKLMDSENFYFLKVIQRDKKLTDLGI